MPIKITICRKRRIKTKIGYEITVTEFEPIINANGIVIISPATGVKQSFYFKFAEFLQSEGYATYTFDFSGIGESKNRSLKKFDTTASNWGNNDLEAVLQFYRNKYLNKNMVVIGHSIGGQLIGLAPSSLGIDKIILIAAQGGYWKFWKGTKRFRMLLNWYLLFPLLTRVYGFFPGKRLKLMEDLPRSMSLEWRKWCTSPNYLFDHIDIDKLYYSKINCALISYSISDDRFAPKKAVDWITEKYNNTQRTRKHLNLVHFRTTKIGHFGFFKEKMKHTLWKMIVDDLNTKFKPLKA